MAGRIRGLKKNENGSIYTHIAIPPEMADDALQLFKRGYTPNDWVRIGIRATMKSEMI